MHVTNMYIHRVFHFQSIPDFQDFAGIKNHIQYLDIEDALQAEFHPMRDVVPPEKVRAYHVFVT
jgi:hypothetical protein